MWIEQIETQAVDWVTEPPATEELIAWAEGEVEVFFPDSLKEFLTESDGLCYRIPAPDADPDDLFQFLYDCDTLVETNQNLRDVDVFIEQNRGFLFFASAPNGDYFGFPVENNRAIDRDIICMSHENFADRWIAAASLEELITGFLMGLGDFEEARGQ